MPAHAPDWRRRARPPSSSRGRGRRAARRSSRARCCPSARRRGRAPRPPRAAPTRWWCRGDVHPLAPAAATLRSSGGTGSQAHTSAPVRASNARTTPPGESMRRLSSTIAPTITRGRRSPRAARSRRTRRARARRCPAPRSTLPPAPKSAHGTPVAASSAISRASSVPMIDAAPAARALRRRSVEPRRNAAAVHDVEPRGVHAGVVAPAFAPGLRVEREHAAARRAGSRGRRPPGWA